MDTQFIHSFSTTLFIFTYNLNHILNISQCILWGKTGISEGISGHLDQMLYTQEELITYEVRESQILQIYNNLHCVEPTYNINRAIYKETTEKLWYDGREMVNKYH